MNTVKVGDLVRVVNPISDKRRGQCTSGYSYLFQQLLEMGWIVEVIKDNRLGWMVQQQPNTIYIKLPDEIVQPAPPFGMMGIRSYDVEVVFTT